MRIFIKKLKFIPLVASLVITSACTSTPIAAPKVVPKPAPKVTKPSEIKGSIAQLATRILHHPKIKLMRGHVSGRVDTATAYHNISSASRGYSARLSSYGNAPGGYAKLDKRMLQTMLYMADVKGWSYHVTEIAGGSHSRNSRHYRGVAFDVDRINGVKVGYGKAYYREFMNICRQRGATEVLGPGSKGHDRHIHIAWK